MTCFSDSPFAMLSGHNCVLMVHSKQSTSNSPGIIVSNYSEGGAWFHLWINTIVYTTLDFPQTFGVQKLMMTYPAWLKRQDDLIVQEAKGNSFVLVVQFLPLICYLNCKVQIKMEGNLLCLVFVRRVNETFHSSLKGCDWRDDVSDPWLKILEKERERHHCLVKVSVEQRLPGGLWISCQLSLFCILCIVSIWVHFSHMKVE